MNMRHLPFLEVFEDASGGNIKTPSSEFLEYGEMPVIDQGQSFIAGYVNDPVKICKSKPPVIIFGDHTKVIKYVDFHFAMGADGTKVLTPKNGNHAKYLFYALKALHIPDAGYSRHYKFLKETTIPLPPLAEQKQIAAILDAADALRTKRRESLAQLDALLQSTFLTLFGDPVENPMGWPTTSLIEQCDSKRGISYGVVQRGTHVPTGVPVIRIRDLTGSGIDPEGLIRCSKEITSTYRRTILQGGELVISIRGTVGRIGLVPHELKDGNITRELALIPLKAGVVREFVLELLRTDSVFKRLADDVKGIAQRGINLKDLRELPIIIPPLPLQQKFAAIVESVERQKDAQRAHLAELDALFAALQHRAFRGEL
jgi:type I restriction enzyme S subunit